MEFKIIRKEDKPLLQREECIAEVSDSKTPSNAELKKLISEKMKKDESLILIKKISQKFGMRGTTARFYIYQNADAIKKFERFRKIKTVEAAK